MSVGGEGGVVGTVLEPASHSQVDSVDVSGHCYHLLGRGWGQVPAKGEGCC